MRAPEFWSRSDPKSRLAAAALAPFGWIYAAATEWKRTHSVPARPKAKIVCVGNLTVGGTGKTPVALAVARALTARGLRVVILTRGYGGRIDDAAVVDCAVHSAADVGDEPLLLAAAAPVVVARDRVRGAQLADSLGADVIVMDDGHQNFTLAKELSIVVVDAVAGFGNGAVVPAGPLREPARRGLARADLVVLVGDGAPKLPGYAGPVVRAQLVPRDGAALRGQRVVAFAGIGRPEKFFATLRELGAEPVATVPFGDHHVFTAAEIARLKAKARNAGAMLVTTEKDYVRLTPPEREGVIALAVRAEFSQSAALEDLLDRMLTREACR